MYSPTKVMMLRRLGNTSRPVAQNQSFRPEPTAKPNESTITSVRPKVRKLHSAEFALPGSDEATAYARARYKRPGQPRYARKRCARCDDAWVRSGSPA